MTRWFARCFGEVDAVDVSPRGRSSAIAVAAALASGIGDAGLGIESAARAFGLDFVPLMEEDYYLVCLADALEQPPVVALRGLLKSPGWRQALLALPGYAPSSSGEVLSLTRALPWWNFRAPKALPATKAVAGS